jgi:Ser/Thr protein kinase RdoA (MazF antagonist)
METLAQLRSEVLPHFPGLATAQASPLGNGLINQTFLVETGAGRFVLQRLAPIFPAAINDNIVAVTAALARAGMPTPRLLPTLDGRTCLDLGPSGGIWRLQTYVDGVGFDTVQSPAQAAAAGALVARFHRAVDGLDHSFTGLRVGVHDTAAHLERLRAAVTRHPDHRLAEQVGPLADRILGAAETLPPLPVLPDRICHGDLKLNNIVFAGAQAPANHTAICLIDLDTVGPMSLAHELGDAWRSWCNSSGEDATEARVDGTVFRASLEGYRRDLGRALTRDEREALLVSVEWISLELASRFAADALDESYFGWNPARYPNRGEHNLARARGQLALHRAFSATRGERATDLDRT